MLRRRFGACVLALFMSVVVLHPGVSSAASDGCPGAKDVPVDAATRTQATRSVLCLVNRLRASRGLRALRLSRQLGVAARAHSTDMVALQYFAHDGPAGDSLGMRVRRSGYAATHPAFDVGEALAWGELATPRILMDALMNSPVHRHILMGASARDVGIGLTLGAPADDVAGPCSTLVIDVGA